MVPLVDRFDGPTDPTWRYGLLGGSLAAATTLAMYWLLPGTLHPEPVLLIAFVAGYKYDGSRSKVSALGRRIGVVGGLGALPYFYGVAVASTGIDGPLWFLLAGTALVTVPALSIPILLSIVLGFVGAYLGDWLDGRIERRREQTTTA